MTKIPVNGILVVYHHYLFENAATIMEHVNSFKKHSRFKVWEVNTELGFPEGLNQLDFKIIILHYSLYGSFYLLNGKFLKYLEESVNSYKICIFQDEYHYCKQRFAFLNYYKINCIYTLLEPPYFSQVYQKYTQVPAIYHTIPGYVSKTLIQTSNNYVKPYDDRKIDIGYRGRELISYMGRGALEKYEIAVKFREYAIQQNINLKLDIETAEEKRLYGDNWYKFLSECRGCLGTEAGVSIFDIDDRVRVEYLQLINENPKITMDDLSLKLLNQWENNIFYRTISPRHFEAAAFRICQILFEGHYSGILEPMVHYIPLKKDFSNFGEVVSLFTDQNIWTTITENAYQDLIASNRYSYAKFIEDFDQKLIEQGFHPSILDSKITQVDKLLSIGDTYRQVLGNLKSVRNRPFWGREFLAIFIRPLLLTYRNLRKQFFSMNSMQPWRKY